MGIRIKKNDSVVVISGRNKDLKTPHRVLSVDPGKGVALVENVNFVKRHTRANPQKNIKGGILEKEAPLPLCVLMLVCKDCQQPTRVAIKALEEGRRARVCKKCNAVMD